MTEFSHTPLSFKRRLVTLAHFSVKSWIAEVIDVARGLVTLAKIAVKIDPMTPRVLVFAA